MLGHPSVGMMRKIIENCMAHNLKEAKFPKTSYFICTACAIGKLILRWTVQVFYGINLHIYSWSHVCLLLTRGHTFAKIIAQVIRLKANFPKHRIQSN
jgi:hypothetical protein